MGAIVEVIPSVLTMFGLGYLLGQGGQAVNNAGQGLDAAGQGVQAATTGITQLVEVLIVGGVVVFAAQFIRK